MRSRIISTLRGRRCRQHLRILTECELVTPSSEAARSTTLEIDKMKEIENGWSNTQDLETRFEQLGEVLEVMKKQQESEKK